MKNAARIKKLGEILDKFRIDDPEIAPLMEVLHSDIFELERQIEILTEAGVELHKEKEHKAVMEVILNSARKLTMADGGTLYMLEDIYGDDIYNPGEIKERLLHFEVLQNDTMGVYLKRTVKSKIFLPPVPLEIDGKPNHSNVSAYCAITGELINIEDVYDAKGFDFSGTKKYDATTGYRSKSMLVLPLRDHQFEIIGVMQLINRKNVSGEIIPFTQADSAILQAISFQAAVTLTTQKLVQEQVELFNSFVKVLAEGLGEKANYHYGHINRVAGLTLDLAEEINTWDKGIYKSISFTESETKELWLAGWMHDIGKLTTPENIVSKQLKLETMINRMELITERFNSKIKDLELELLQAENKILKSGGNLSELEGLKAEQVAQKASMLKDLKAINRTNFGGEFLDAETGGAIVRAQGLTTLNWVEKTMGMHNDREAIMELAFLDTPYAQPLVDDLELECLNIKRGTLSNSERQIVNDHADRSWRWLFKLPFPRGMKRLPLYAAAHHEHLDGTGYPIGLKESQIPFQARLIAISDIFEALTASDRPYKKPMMLSEAIKILGFMVKDNHLDPEIANIFMESGLYLVWAKKHLQDSQIDEIDVQAWKEKFSPKAFENSLPAYQKERWKDEA
ncbi:MAG: HD domain-containing phosphohydrolase [SAR324 cluster bacterium]|nr:HD domain-containing phosphohydrolase [SAR324 cluster bacterium]